MIVALWVVLGFYGIMLILHGKRHHETEADVVRVEDWQGRHAGRMFEQGNDLSKLTDRVDGIDVEQVGIRDHIDKFCRRVDLNAKTLVSLDDMLRTDRVYQAKDADRDRKANEGRITAFACQLRIAAAKLESHDYDA